MESDLAFERFNAALKDLQMQDIGGPIPPTIFVCGTPRAGTTYLYQMISYVGHVGYINNLTARFAGHPTLGALLSEAVALPKKFSGRSNFGQTSDISEPHEFGRGWQNILGGNGLQEPKTIVPLTDVQIAQITNIAQAYGKPTVFKSFAYLWYTDQLSTQIKNSLWIHVTRDVVKTAASLEKLYHLRGTVDERDLWQSAVLYKTRESFDFSDLNTKCLRQVTDLDEYIRNAFSKIESPRKFTISLDSLQTDPASCLRDIFNHFSVLYRSESLDMIT